MIAVFIFLAVTEVIMFLLLAGIVLEIIEWYLNRTDVRRLKK